jgi:hypothetical protein
VTITPANVAKGAGSELGEGTAGATIAAGDSLYIDTADSNKLKLCDANAASPANAFEGIALHGAANNQPIKYLKAGDITIGGTLVQAQVYVQSATPGKIAPAADLASGWTTTVIGVAKTSGVLTVKKVTAGSAIA